MDRLDQPGLIIIVLYGVGWHGQVAGSSGFVVSEQHNDDRGRVPG